MLLHVNITKYPKNLENSKMEEIYFFFFRIYIKYLYITKYPENPES